MLGLREHVLEGLGAAVPGRFDREFVTGAQREEAPVLTADLLHVLDETVEIQLLGLTLEGIQVDDDPVLSLVGLGDPLGDGRILRSSSCFHGGRIEA